MSHVTYRIVRHDEGWAYMVNGVFGRCACGFRRLAGMRGARRGEKPSEDTN